MSSQSAVPGLSILESGGHRVVLMTVASPQQAKFGTRYHHTKIVPFFTSLRLGSDVDVSALNKIPQFTALARADYIEANAIRAGPAATP